MPPAAEVPILSFASPAEWRKWLDANHERSDGIWLQLFKKDSGIETIAYAEALDEALCYGWIDGQKKKYDTQSWLQKFTPRRARSMWSKKNTEHVARLMQSGKMQPAGLHQIEAAKQDGRWAQAYDSTSQMSIPSDFLSELAKKKKAQAFFETLTKANRYAIAWRLQTAKKPETRARRMEQILGMLERGEKFHS